jgi:uncharacterized Fe-S cluster protein YjdI
MTGVGIPAVLAFAVAASLAALTVAGSGATLVGSVPKTTEWNVDHTSVGSFNVVSCASTRFCVAVGTSTGTDSTVEFNGSNRGVARTLEKFEGEVVALSCPAVGWCVALTDLAAATVLHGSSWSRLTTLDPNPGPPYPGMANGVSCTSSRFCVAVDAQGNAETYNGTTWTTPEQIDQDFPLNDVSCGTSRHCVAVDGGGRIVQLRDGHWSDPEAVDSAPLTTISCVGVDFCVAVDLGGRDVALTSSGWSQPSAIDSLANAPIEVSCPQRDKCVAVDSSGRVLLLTARGWTAPQPPNVNSESFVNSLVDVSCPIGQASFCAAVDSSGDSWTTDAIPK